jgi:hypothetical protein
MSAREFQTWRLFFRMRPFGGDVEDLRFGQLAALFFNAWRDGGRARGPGDFTFGTAPVGRQDAQEMGDLLKRWFAQRREAQ